MRYLVSDNVNAIEDFSQAILRDAVDARSYGGRGRCYAELGCHRDAIADLDVALRLDPRLTLARQTRGYCLYWLREYEASVRDLTEVLEQNEKGANNYRWRALRTGRCSTSKMPRPT